MRGTRLAQCAGVNRDRLGFVGASALATVGLVVFLFGPLPIAEGLYRAGLWRRLTPDDVREQFGTKYHKDLLRCSKGVNGWDYICELDKNRFYDKLGVMGSVFGIGWWAELPPGPVPDRSALEAEGQARLERMRRSQR
jgi:hypothetical protein